MIHAACDAQIERWAKRAREAEATVERGLATLDELDDFLIQIPGSSSWEQNYDLLRTITGKAAIDLRAVLATPPEKEQP